MEITIYGSRGSHPFSSRQNLVSGGNTSCLKIEYGNETLLLDGGSGLLQYLEELRPQLEKGIPLRLEILLSHLHLDHILGLAAFTPLWSPGNDILIYTKSRDSRPLAQQILGAFSPPYWPVSLADMLQASIIEIGNSEFETRGGLKILPFAASHPDNTTAFRITGDKTLVYMADYELAANEEPGQDSLSLCHDADLILFDSSYLPLDYPAKTGWGHSTYEHGLSLSKLVGCPRMIFTHFSPEYSDTVLQQVQETLSQQGSEYLVAFDGMEITL